MKRERHDPEDGIRASQERPVRDSRHVGSQRKLSAIMGASVLALSAGRFAQTAAGRRKPAAAVDAGQRRRQEIVVTGYARSLANALAGQARFDGVIESLSAEDVGKLPDTSIADAISRLPGVAVQTQQGRGEMISIRGFRGFHRRAAEPPRDRHHR
jgi:iron complex outermembrane receptor protein